MCALRIKDSQLRVRQEEQPRCDADTDDSANKSISSPASTHSAACKAMPSSQVNAVSETALPSDWILVDCRKACPVAGGGSPMGNLA